MQRKIIVRLGIGLVIVASSIYYFFILAKLSINTVPADALVRVDGKAVARTPADGIEVSVGLHKLEVTHSYYAPYSEQINVGYGDRIVRDLNLELGEGTLQLLSNPKGAWVELDGQRLPAVTPTQIKLPSGPHEITMGQTERRPVSQSVELNAGEQLAVNLSLNIDPHGTLKFQVKPAGAKVRFVDQQLTYKSGMRLPIGEYGISVSKPGYVTQKLRYTVRYGDNQRPITLQRQYATLNVDVREKTALVNVSYVNGGQQISRPYLANMRVPVGQIKVRAGAMGHRTQTKTISLGAKGARLKFTLPTLNVEVGSEFSDPLTRGSDLQGESGPTMVVVPAGQFQMGNNAGPPSERPAHTVALTQPFGVAKYEITVAQFQKFVAQTKRNVDSRIYKLAANVPVAYISYKDAVAYTQWLSEQTGKTYRLLTESEWEYVARAGSQASYAFGNDPLKICEYANIGDLAAKKKFRSWLVTNCNDGQVRPGVGGQYKANKFGLHDMYGNVAEWVLECGMPDYSLASGIGSDPISGASCENHGYRGGSWDSTAQEAASSYRNATSRLSDDRGIRVMREF